ncbi:nitrous oxide reductase accessory protein NosL [Aestuariibius sp. HNIBRBA575]|uniref:nitrous oxide reductase accessory protein NosL n=1 Tax=Aestuariibius sp. HNIBRBA575 TaxID=3233343 RepID=UPI0034A29706
MKPLILIACCALIACKEEVATAPPAPVAMTEAALSHFCQMNVLEHGGPKGQIHLEGHPSPLFFAQVRDLVTYVKSPERVADMEAIYVSDMGMADSWRYPGAENWIDAEQAVYVVGSNVAGGMGAPEIVPFSDAQSAQGFIDQYGGQLHALADIPEDAVLGPVDLDAPLETPL